MAINRRAGGHAFSFDGEVCAKCGMTTVQFEDTGKPRCPGRPTPLRRLSVRFREVR
jgi:hypothetical protein